MYDLIFVFKLVSPVVQSTSPVHQSSPVIVDGLFGSHSFWEPISSPVRVGETTLVACGLCSLVQADACTVALWH